MRIAIDARPLASPLTGIGRYTHELLKRLLRMDHSWFLYTDRPLQIELPSSENVVIRTGNAAGGTPGSLRWAQWEYVRWAKKDGIHVFWSPRHHLPLLMPSSTRTIVTIHDLVWKRFPDTMQRKNYWLERIMMGRSLKKADRVICVSHFTAKELVHFYPKCSNKTTVIYEGATEIDVQGSITRRFSEPYLLFVGTMEPRKNLKRLLEAFAVSEVSPVKLVITGASGWGGVEIESWISNLGLHDSVVNLGYVSDLELDDLYQHATALVMPSLYEGFGLPVVEAMKRGTASIVSRGTSLEEICGPAALIVNPYSTQEIANALAEVLDPKVNGSLSKAARTRAAMFDWDRACRQTLKLLEEFTTSSLH